MLIILISRRCICKRPFGKPQRLAPGIVGWKAGVETSRALGPLLWGLVGEVLLKNRLCWKFNVKRFLLLAESIYIHLWGSPGFLAL